MIFCRKKANCQMKIRLRIVSKVSNLGNKNMRKTLISYSLAGRKNALEITRNIYGYKDSSNHGKYKYQREGIFSHIPYEKLSKGTFWIDPKHKEEVVSELLKLNIKLKVIDITIHA